MYFKKFILKPYISDCIFWLLNTDDPELSLFQLIQAAVQFPTSAANVTLLQLLLSAGRAAIDRYLLPAGPTAANPPHTVAAVDRWGRQTDRQTRGGSSHPLARQPISCYYYACDLSYFDFVLCPSSSQILATNFQISFSRKSRPPQCSLASLAEVSKVTPPLKNPRSANADGRTPYRYIDPVAFYAISVVYRPRMINVISGYLS